MASSGWPPLERRGPVVTEANVAAFERKLGANLPEEYRTFLLELNGGRTHEDHARFAVGKRDGDELSTLFSLDDPNETHDLEARGLFLRANGRVPRAVLPIGSAGGGIVCLALEGAERGEVWYFDTLNERPDDANPRVLWHDRRDFVRLAANFRDFMASLTPLP